MQLQVIQKMVKVSRVCVMSLLPIVTFCMLLLQLLLHWPR